MEAIIVALIVGTMATIGQAWQRHGDAKARRADKEMDWARQDLVAAQAAQAASLLLAENKKVAETAAVTNGKLDVIHILVNSNMTAAMQSELDATKREVVGLKEIVRLNKQGGQEPSNEALEVIRATEDKVAKLEAELRDRLKQTKVAEKEGRK
jgi:hypothetical protein